MDKWLHPYMAGLFDADGSVGIRKKKSQAKSGGYLYRMEVIFHGCDQSPFLVGKEVWGGSLISRPPQKEGWRPTFQWNMQARKASAFLKDIQPYLIIKLDRVVLALEFQGHIQKHAHLRYRAQGTQVHPEEVYRERERLYLLMKELNSRGVKVQS